MQSVQFVRNELDLGSKLNGAVHENRLSDFSWLLASLTENPLEFAEFELPEIQNTNTTEPLNYDGIPIILGPKRPLAEQSGIERASIYAHILKTDGFKQVLLADCLNPIPYSDKDDKSHIPEEIIDNCHPSVQARLKKPQQPVANGINVEGFYNTITEVKNSFSSAA